MDQGIHDVPRIYADGRLTGDPPLFDHDAHDIVVHCGGTTDQALVDHLWRA